MALMLLSGGHLGGPGPCGPGGLGGDACSTREAGSQTVTNGPVGPYPPT